MRKHDPAAPDALTKAQHDALVEHLGRPVTWAPAHSRAYGAGGAESVHDESIGSIAEDFGDEPDDWGLLGWDDEGAAA